MTNLEEIESSQKQWNEVLKQQEAMFSLMTESEYKLFSMLKPKLYMDGNAWCCLYGENIQDGISGFGDTPHKAVINWNHQWQLKPNKK